MIFKGFAKNIPNKKLCAVISNPTSSIKTVLNGKQEKLCVAAKVLVVF